MMIQISPQNHVTLDGSGGGQISIGPPQGTVWQINLASVSTTSTSNAAACTLYRGSTSGPIEKVDNTALGNSDSTTRVAAVPFYAGQVLWAVWTGGDAGATAILQVYGSQKARADPPFAEAPASEGFTSVPNSLSAGNPSGNGLVVIGSSIPPELVAYYFAIYSANVTKAYIRMQPDSSDYHYEIVGTVPASGGGVFHAEGWVSSGVVKEFFDDRYFPSAGPALSTWGVFTASTNYAVTFGNVFAGAKSGIVEIECSDFQINTLQLATVDFTIDSVSQPRGIVFYDKIPSAATTAVATEQVVYTLPPVNFYPGRAYRCVVAISIRSAVAQNPLVNVRENSLAGTLLCIGPRVEITVVGIDTLAYRDFFFINNTAAVITAGLVVTITPSVAAIVTLDGAGFGGSGMAEFSVFDVGRAADFSPAVQLT